MTMPMEPVCQSCGMPLSRDDQGGGTETGGERSSRYCSHCYQEGTFTQPDLQVGEMQERVAEKLRGAQIPEHVATELTSQIPQLERWRIT